MRLTCRAAVAAGLVLHAASAAALTMSDGTLSINGSGTWGYLRTDDNFYLADSDGDYATAGFDVALSARPADQLVITAQLGFDPDEVALEWAFAEWRFSDLARVRLGQVKQPLGNYMELQFIGTARPFYFLPTSVYGPADIGATSYFGAGVTGALPCGDGYELQYDAYGGAIELAVFEPYEVLEEGHDPAELPELEEQLIENIVGGRVSLVTPPGLVLRLSGYGGSVRKEAGEGRPAFFAGGLSALHHGERLWVSVEGFGFVESGSESQLSGYGEVAWFLTKSVQVAARYEVTRTFLEDVSGGSPLLRHDEAGLGLNYWFNPDFVLKTSVHRAEGLRFVGPREDASPPSGPTLLVVAGAQFTF